MLQDRLLLNKRGWFDFFFVFLRRLIGEPLVENGTGLSFWGINEERGVGVGWLGHQVTRRDVL